MQKSLKDVMSDEFITFPQGFALNSVLENERPELYRLELPFQLGPLTTMHSARARAAI